MGREVGNFAEGNIGEARAKPPIGHGHWSLRLLESKVAEMGIVDRASESKRGR
jgi:hypothetical protein